MIDKIKILFPLFCLMTLVFPVYAQEHQGPLRYNPAMMGEVRKNTANLRTSALTLPFFEDFTDNSVYTNPLFWVESEVYINNTMCKSPVSRGVATFDALDKNGYPYDSFSNGHFRYADSLTSKPFDFSSFLPSDSLYLSFFYQPQGYGFYPLTGDSLILYMKVRYGDWVPVWTTPGTTLQPFQQVLIPITDTLYFHSTFQFRFVNIAALNFSDAIWNVDYIRMDKNRTMYDTAVNDVAFTTDPTYLLNDYTSMPYRQFLANPAGERTNTFFDSINNNNGLAVAVNHGYFTTVLNTGAPLYNSSITGPVNIPASTVTALNDSAYRATIPMPSDPYQKVVFESKYFIQSTTGTGPVANDTIVKDQVFDNYLAYDDGTAEQSYYLTLYPTLPGEISIEHHLNVPDTMRGMAIYFARMIPVPSFKTFYIRVYSQLAGVSGATSDHLLYTQFDCSPGYVDTQNHFWNYKFDTPLALPAGTFYAGIFLLAQSGDDTLCFGLDMNRIGGNHVYYNVLSSWNSSIVQGAVMMRPLLGKEITASSVKETAWTERNTWKVSPNPVRERLQYDFPGDDEAQYTIINTVGQVIIKGVVTPGGKVDVRNLVPGIYFTTLAVNQQQAVPQKFIKL